MQGSSSQTRLFSDTRKQSSRRTRTWAPFLRSHDAREPIRSYDIEAGKQNSARLHEVNTAASGLFPVELKHFIHSNLVDYFAFQLAFCIPNPAVMSSPGRKRPNFQTINRPDAWLQLVKGRYRQNPGSVYLHVRRWGESTDYHCIVHSHRAKPMYGPSFAAVQLCVGKRANCRSTISIPSENTFRGRPSLPCFA